MQKRMLISSSCVEAPRGGICKPVGTLVLAIEPYPSAKKPWGENVKKHSRGKIDLERLRGGGLPLGVDTRNLRGLCHELISLH
jgi:hypothetical protein